MALDKTTLKNSIKSAFQSAIGSGDAEEEIAVAISNAIDIFVKSGTVDPAGTPTPMAAGGDPVTGTGKIT